MRIEYGDNMNIRFARPSDAATLLAIYAPYVENTAITFEYEVPTIEDFATRIEKTLEKYPYLVAEVNRTPKVRQKKSNFWGAFK